MSIYVFPGINKDCSIVYDATTLTAEEKKRGIELAALPEPEEPEKREGKYAVLRGDLITGQVWYEYIDLPTDPLEQHISDLEEALALLHMEVVKLDTASTP